MAVAPGQGGEVTFPRASPAPMVRRAGRFPLQRRSHRAYASPRSAFGAMP